MTETAQLDDECLEKRDDEGGLPSRGHNVEPGITDQ